MAVTAAQLVLKVSGETKSAEDSLDKLNSRVHDSGGFFKNLASTALGTFTGMLGVNGVTEAFGFLKDQLVDTVKAGMDAQQAQAQLTQGLLSTHDASGETTQSLEDLAEKYSKVTTFSKTAIEQSEAISLTFTNIGKDVFPQATMAAEDLATRMGESLPSATLQLDKALGDPIKGYAQLQRVGVVFTAQQVEQIKAMSKAGDVAGAQKIILGELSKEFGGSAQAAGKTFAGQLQILSNQLEDTKEKVGMALLPVLNQLLALIMPLVGWLGNLVGNGLGLLSSFLTSTVIPALSQLATVFGQTGKGVAPLQASFSQIATSLQAQIGPIIQQAISWFRTGLMPAVQSLLPHLQQFGGVLLTDVVPVLAKVGSAILSVDTILAGGLLKEIEAILPTALKFAGVLLDNLGGAFKALMPLVLQVVSGAQQFAGFIAANVLPVIGQVYAFILSSLVPILNTLFSVFKTDIIPILQTLWNNIQTNVIPAVEKIWDTIASKLIPALEKLWAKISPILIPALQFLGGLLKAVLTPILNTLGWVLGNVVGPAISLVITIIGWLIDKIADAIGAVGNIGDAFRALGQVAGAIWGGIQAAFKAGINLIIADINGFITLLDKIQIHVPAVGVGPVHTPAFDWNGLGIPQIPYLAEGGDILRSGLAMVGERGAGSALTPARCRGCPARQKW